MLGDIKTDGCQELMVGKVDGQAGGPVDGQASGWAGMQTSG